MSPELTNAQTHILINLVKREAFRPGYPAEYTMDNYRIWPRRLKQMLPIVRKLEASLGAYDMAPVYSALPAGRSEDK